MISSDFTSCSFPEISYILKFAWLFSAFIFISAFIFNENFPLPLALNLTHLSG